ncbi:hypothetical protein DPSP01_004522 [Paraphaeosphaeria sporulosa]
MAMASTNFWSSLDTETPELPAELPTPANTVTRTAYASKKKMRQMALESETAFDATTIDASTMNEDEATGIGTKPEPARAGESNTAEAAEDAQKAAEHIAEKKAKKAAKKLRQKLKKGVIALDAMRQHKGEVTNGVKDARGEASGAQDGDAAASANGSVGDAAQSIASQVNAARPVQVQSGMDHEEEDFFLGALSALHLPDPNELAKLENASTTSDGQDDDNGLPTETAASTSVQIDAPADSTTMSRKNTIANKRKKKSKKKAREIKAQTELQAKLRKERFEAWEVGLAASSFVCFLTWGFYANLVHF